MLVPHTRATATPASTAATAPGSPPPARWYAATAAATRSAPATRTMHATPVILVTCRLPMAMSAAIPRPPANTRIERTTSGAMTSSARQHNSSDVPKGWRRYFFS